MKIVTLFNAPGFLRRHVSAVPTVINISPTGGAEIFNGVNAACDKEIFTFSKIRNSLYESRMEKQP